ncbi:MAG TPA: carbamoyltransferase C-terminal domain-containing protein [Polyangiaceae bacterium]|jgi:carbamoyltransferase
MRYFLSFAYNVHDSSVSVCDETRVLLVLEAERFFGEKKKGCTRAEMDELIAAALAHCGVDVHELAGVVCTAYKNEHVPESLRHVKWLAEHELAIQGVRFNALVMNHHLAHAAIVHAFPDVSDVAIDVCDGGGDFGDTHGIYRYQHGRISQLANRPIHDAFSSRFYDVVSRYVYGRIMCEGKLMALASLGQTRSEMIAFVRDHLAMFHDAPPEQSCAELARHFPFDDYRKSVVAFDLAASAQRVFEELRVEAVAALPSDTPDVMLAGGATLNIVANTRVREFLQPKRRLLLPPCCDDTGQSLGALLYYCHERAGLKVSAAMPFLGYSDRIDESTLTAADVTDELVAQLAAGGIVFLHRGQSEIGPRALGHRSILALPTRRSFDLINHVIKEREFYRPLAPILPVESVSSWFDWEGESKYMLYAAKTRRETQLRAPGICHYDDTARLQTVSRGEDPFLHALLNQIGQATGAPILINTSLNPRGAPILSKLPATLAFRDSLPGLGIKVFHAGRFQS